MQFNEGNQAKVRSLREAWDRSIEGPLAFLDCWEEIPCNPCEGACRKGAITVGPDICAPPSYDPDKCDGCGKCVSICPGMAVFILDRSVGGGLARVTLPYEMRDEMGVEQEAWVVDGEGNELAKGKIVRVSGAARIGQTLLVTVEVGEEWALKVRGVRGRRKVVEEPEEVDDIELTDDFVFCRCEEVSCSRVREILANEFYSLTALRRFSRVGLGFCQGRFCQSILRDQFLSQSSREGRDVEAFRVRPPVRPVRLSRLGGEDGRCS